MPDDLDAVELLDVGADGAPVIVINEGGTAPFLLTCDHAGRAVPRRLGDLGVAPAEMDRHIAYDLGAADLARRLSNMLDAPLVMQRYSRLVIDCNRPRDAPDAMPMVSDGTVVPANHDLSEAHRAQRYEAIHRPYHDTIAALLDRRTEADGAPILLSVHSFTPVLAGQRRRCHAGLLFNRDPRVGHLMMEALEAAETGLTLAFNQPYGVDDQSDYTIPVHGERRGIPHGLIEVRNDQLANAAGRERWANLICVAVRHAAGHILPGPAKSRPPARS